MSFEETKYNIFVLEESGGPIRAEELYNLLGLVLDDALAFSNVVEGSKLACEDKGELVQALRYLLKDAVNTFHTNEEGIRDLSIQTKREMSELSVEAKRVRAKSESLDALIKKHSENKTDLTQKKEEAKQKHAQFLQIKTECESLTEQISRLNDASLDGLKDQLKVLKKDAENRQKQADDLNSKIKKANEAIEDCQNELDRTIQEHDDAKKKLRKIENDLKETRGALKEVESKKSETKKIFLELETNQAALLECAAQYSVVYNAIHAAVNDPFICENIFSIDGNTFQVPLDLPGFEGSMELKNAADLKAWMDRTQKQIEYLISAYQEELRQIVSAAEKLAAQWS